MYLTQEKSKVVNDWNTTLEIAKNWNTYGSTIKNEIVRQKSQNDISKKNELTASKKISVYNVTKCKHKNCAKY